MFPIILFKRRYKIPNTTSKEALWSNEYVDPFFDSLYVFK